MIRQVKFEADGQVVRMARAPATYHLDAATGLDRMFQRRLQSVNDKSQGIKQVAFTCSIAADEECLPLQLDVALPTAFEVFHTHALRHFSLA